ncbi:MAG: FKBP-type peptidyl-prolyl cis-trans isomerase [Bacteroidales bacterium]|nr:FKBP-type peptidyl-prolyl cis-trans isomerase [Bacteroidales bacterium]
MINYNREVVKTENQEIDDFIARYRWDMMKTQTGLRYMIYENGHGNHARQGDQVSIKYKINLLTGDLVFQSDTGSTVILEIGKRKVVSGLEEGILQMQQGDRAKLIVPSHLAYGLLGDMASIPAGATLVIDVELCTVNKQAK